MPREHEGIGSLLSVLAAKDNDLLCFLGLAKSMGYISNWSKEIRSDRLASFGFANNQTVSMFKDEIRFNSTMITVVKHVGALA